MTPKERAYAAGLFDGRGSVGISRTKSNGRVYHQLRLSISSSDARLIAWLKERSGTGSIQPGHVSSAKHRVGWNWLVHDERAAAFLREIQPFAIVKADRIAAAIAFRDLVHPHGYGGRKRGERLTSSDLEQRERARVQLKLLNHRGTG